MAKFAIECPKCGSINQASTFIFAKKAIKCGTCGEEINVKESRLTSKKCPKCGSVFVCDQAKAKGKKCPVCGSEIDVLMAATAEYKIETLNCPQCACAIEVDKTKDIAYCPICDCRIEVKKELAKSKLVTDTGVSVIQYEGDNSTFVWKHPIEDFNLGSQLIVHESQEAVFFLNGEALDTFGPGRHTLETENLPVLKKIYSLPTGSQSPFHAEVYFVNLTTRMSIKWGTDSRVRFIDPATGVPLNIGASGEMNLRVSDSRKLLVKLVGTTDRLFDKHVLESTEKDGNPDEAVRMIKGFFRAPLMTQVKSYLAGTIKEQGIDIMEIDAHMDILSKALRDRIAPAFEEYGLTVPEFYITNVLLPEDDENFKKLRKIRAGAYIGVKEEETMASIAQAARQRKLIEEQTEAQLKMVRAQGEAEAAKAIGLAEAEVMREKGYTEKDVLAAEVQKAYAEGLGNMGSGGSGGGGGGLASDLVGMMAGMKMANKMFDQLDNVPGEQKHSPVASAPTWTCECGEDGNTKAFCMSCGKPKPVKKEAGSWNCPVCGYKGITSNFCPDCGAKRPEASSGWDCPNCGCKGITSNFCPDCGTKRPEASSGWDCPACGCKGIKSRFCPDCGAKRPE